MQAHQESHLSEKGRGDKQIYVMLVPRELDKLALHQAAVVAQKRLARGCRLNATEATVLISSQILEFVTPIKVTLNN